VVVWILLFAASLYFLNVLLAMFSSSSQGQGLTSTDWAGYIITPNLGDASQQVVGINASWTVPRVRVFSFDAYSSAWIGIGGHSEKTLIQVGTEHDSVNGKEFYAVWYEMLPDTAIRIDTISISPGDTIIASITLVNSDIDQWAIRIHDITSGQGFYRTFIYNSSRLSAEWILERPHISDKISSLADFGTVTFEDSYVKIGDNIGKIGNYSYSQVIMTNDLSKQLTSVAPLGEDEASFSVTYMASS
jgi:hypothetical protein